MKVLVIGLSLCLDYSYSSLTPLNTLTATYEIIPNSASSDDQLSLLQEYKLSSMKQHGHYNLLLSYASADDQRRKWNPNNDDNEADFMNIPLDYEISLILI